MFSGMIQLLNTVPTRSVVMNSRQKFHDQTIPNKVTIYRYIEMFPATDSILELRVYAEDTLQMITVLDCGLLQENHRFNMHSK
jgi:hypothetical protein